MCNIKQVHYINKSSLKLPGRSGHMADYPRTAREAPPWTTTDGYNLNSETANETRQIANNYNQNEI